MRWGGDLAYRESFLEGSARKDGVCGAAAIEDRLKHGQFLHGKAAAVEMQFRFEGWPDLVRAPLVSDSPDGQMRMKRLVLGREAISANARSQAL